MAQPSSGINWAGDPAGGVTKGAVVAQLADRLGVQATEALAVGDDLNDLEMLEWAGRGIAIKAHRRSW